VSSQWNRIGVNDSSEESFDREVDMIGRYLKRNERSLEKYVENQKMLLDVQLTKKCHDGSRERKEGSSKKALP
jgi:hypothetical protein